MGERKRNIYKRDGKVFTMDLPVYNRGCAAQELCVLFLIGCALDG